MKTLLFHVNTFQAGGIEKVLIELLRALDPNKYKILLSISYYFGDGQSMILELPPYVEVHYLLRHPLLVNSQKKKKTAKIGKVERLLAELIFPPFRKMVQQKELKKLLSGVDVVIDFDTTLAPFHHLFSNKKSAVYRHFRFETSSNQGKIKRLVARLMYYDKVVMLCDEMKGQAAHLFPQLAPKLVRIYNALDWGRIQKMADEKIDNEYIENTSYIVSVGRLHEAQKDFTTLVKAYIACVKKYQISQKLVIVGYGSALEALKALASQAGMEDRMIFTGFQSNPYKFIKHSDLFLFSSKFEGLPTVLIEAMILDKPIIATNCPTGVQELLMDGKAGILVPVGNVNRMAEAIYELLNNKQLQEQFSNARSEFLKNFEPSFMVQEVERLLL